MTTIFIKPAPGCLIRDPDTMKPLAQEGEENPSPRSGAAVLMTGTSLWWKKRLKQHRQQRLQRLMPPENPRERQQKNLRLKKPRLKNPQHQTRGRPDD